MYSVWHYTASHGCTAKPMLGFSKVCKGTWLLLHSAFNETIQYIAHPQVGMYVVADIPQLIFAFTWSLLTSYSRSVCCIGCRYDDASTAG